MPTFDHCFVRRKEAQFLTFLRRAMFKAVNPSPSLAVITVMSLLTNNLQKMTTNSNSVQSASFGSLDDAFRFFMAPSYCSLDDTNPQFSCATCLHALRNSRQKKKTAVVLAKLCRKPYKWLLSWQNSAKKTYKRYSIIWLVSGLCECRLSGLGESDPKFRYFLPTWPKTNKENRHRS